MIVDKTSLNIIHTFSQSEMKRTIINMEDSYQNSFVLLEDTIYYVNSRREFKSLDLSPPYEVKSLFGPDRFEDVCVFGSNIVAVSLTGAIKSPNSSLQGSIPMKTDNQHAPKSNCLHLLSPDLSLQNTLFLGGKRCVVGNLQVTKVKDVGVLWINYALHDLQVVLFNSKTLALAHTEEGISPLSKISSALLTANNILLAGYGEYSQIVSIRL